jgi:hypothetical protein
MAYTPVTYRVISVPDPTQDYAVRYATQADLEGAEALPTSRTGVPENGLYVRDDIPPPTRLTVTQTRLVIPDNLFQTTTTVTESLGIQPQVFVFRTVDETYSHVATVSDMDWWPNTYAEALEDGKNFYRLAECVVSFEEVDTADEFASYTLTRLDLLTASYSTYKLEFEGSDTHVYEAP